MTEQEQRARVEDLERVFRFVRLWMEGTAPMSAVKFVMREHEARWGQISEIELFEFFETVKRANDASSY